MPEFIFLNEQSFLAWLRTERGKQVRALGEELLVAPGHEIPDLIDRIVKLEAEQMRME